MTPPPAEEHHLNITTFRLAGGKPQQVDGVIPATCLGLPKADRNPLTVSLEQYFARQVVG